MQCDTQRADPGPMPHSMKIATCCYCGTRAVLVLRGKDRHELSCSGCGAPLHDLKQMPVPRPEQAKPVRTERPYSGNRKLKAHENPRKRRKKSPFRKFISEAADLIEDIFD